MLALAFFSFAAAQTDISCALLDTSSACGLAFAGLPVLYTSSAVFSTQLSLRVGNLTRVANDLNCSTVAPLRYQTSMFCALSVASAISQGCTFPPRNTSQWLCPSVCSMAPESLDLLISNSSICNTPQQGFKNVKIFSKYCQNATESNSTLQCLNGSSLEQKYCGWSDVQSALQNCSPKEECCNALFNSLNPASSTAKQLPIILIVSIIGSLAALLLAGMAIYAIYRYSRVKTTPKPNDIEKNHTGIKSNPVFAPEFVPMPTHSRHRKSKIPKLTPINTSFVQLPATLTELESKASANSSSKNEQFDGSIINVKAVREFNASLPDELSIRVGDDIVVYKTFDDGWMLGHLASTASSDTEGLKVFPANCVRKLSITALNGEHEFCISIRRSSAPGNRVLTEN